MQPSSKFLEPSSIPRSPDHNNPTHDSHPLPPPPSLSNDPSFSTAPEHPPQISADNESYEEPDHRGDDPRATSHEPAAAREGEEEEENPQIAEQPAGFAPYFTLVSSAGSATTHHPTVHYIFADDPADASPVTDAALDLLEAPREEDDDDDNGGNGGRRKERYVLLEMDGTGSKMVSAKSMSADWAVTAAEVGTAPTWEGGAREEGRGMMLRVEGMEAVDGDGGGEGKGGREKERALEELMEEYERRMGELRRAVGAGAGSAEVVEGAAE